MSESKQIWTAFWICVTLLTGTGGAYSKVMFDKVSSLEKSNAQRIKEVAVLDITNKYIVEKLEKIESKIDKLIKK